MHPPTLARGALERAVRAQRDQALDGLERLSCTAYTAARSLGRCHARGPALGGWFRGTRSAIRCRGSRASGGHSSRIPPPASRAVARVQGRRVCRSRPRPRASVSLLRVPARGDGLRRLRPSGGKSVALERGGARLLAGDGRRERVGRLVETARRAGVAIQVAVADLLAAPFRSEALAGVLVDAPCSATGTMARHPDARWRVTQRTIARAAARPRALLAAAAALVRPGGLLVYATCSLEPEE